jgi:C4-dicarboxylate-specific signal transduction histidine kinase
VIEERTHELSQSNEALQSEIGSHRQARETIQHINEDLVMPAIRRWMRARPRASSSPT